MSPDRIDSVADASAWLEGLIDFEKVRRLPYERMGLEAVRRLLERVGDPQRGLRVIHLAGSKGKGSTALLAESVLRATGERVGTFTSPHLVRWTERFRVDGAEVSEAALVAAVRALRPHVEAMRAEGVGPTFFDATTATALLVFRDARVDRAILEVGLGGRLDSTNVVEPDVTAVTSIELEHTAQLGDTHAAIAREKAGILKPGVPAVVGRLPEEALREVRRRAEEVGAPLSLAGRDFDVAILGEDTDGLRLRLTDGPLDVEAVLPVLGDHQALNASLALACVRRSGAADGDDLARAAERGLATARLPGRVELLSRRPCVVVDSAHTEASARSLGDVLERLRRASGGRVRLVLSISAGKDTPAILRALLPHAADVTVTRAEPLRSLAPADVAAAIREAAPGAAPTVVPNPHLALRAAREGLGPSDVLCVAGSVYLAGIAREVLSPDASAAPVAVTRRPKAPPVAEP